MKGSEVESPCLAPELQNKIIKYGFNSNIGNDKTQKRSIEKQKLSSIIDILVAPTEEDTSKTTCISNCNVISPYIRDPHGVSLKSC